MDVAGENGSAIPGSNNGSRLKTKSGVGCVEGGGKRRKCEGPRTTWRGEGPGSGNYFQEGREGVEGAAGEASQESKGCEKGGSVKRRGWHGCGVK